MDANVWVSGWTLSLSFAFKPISDFEVTALLNISPVERWGIDKDWEIKVAWVPFPHPGGPNSIICNLKPTS